MSAHFNAKATVWSFLPFICSANAIAHDRDACFRSVPQVFASFDAENFETPEGAAVAFDGSVFVSLALTGEIRQVHASGEIKPVAELPLGSLNEFNPERPFPPFAGPLTRRYDGTLFVTLTSNAPGMTGIWRIDPGHEATLIASLPPNSVPNGIALRLGQLYVADSTQGVIWRVSVRGGTPEIWAENKALQPSIGEGPPIPGANGVQIFANEVYVSSSAAQKILAFPIQRRGNAGPPRVVTTNIAADDFAIDVLGNLWVTTNPANTLVRVTQRGSQRVVLTAEDGLDNPTSAVFGRGRRGRNTLYITNAAFPFSSETLRPSVLTIRTLIPGAPPWPF